MMTENSKYKTPNLNQAAYLYAKDIPFLYIEWSPNSDKALFVFENPPDEVLAGWMRDEGLFIKRYEDARNILRDKLEGKG
jgi:hypothetical protein